MGNEAARDAQVAIEMHTLSELCDELHKSIDVLENRLSTVTREEAKAESADEVAPPLVPLANDLRVENSTLRVLTCRLHSLANRIEL